MNKTIAAIIVGGLLLLGLGFYVALGGLNKIGLSIAAKEGIHLLGLTYRGTPQDEALVETFRKTESIIKKYPGANLHTIYYIEPAGKLDTLHVFMGFESGNYPNLPEYLEEKHINCTRVIVADVQAHKWVMPTPQEVKEAIEEFAREKGVSTQGIYVDKIIDKNQVKVLAPLATE